MYFSVLGRFLSYRKDDTYDKTLIVLQLSHDLDFINLSIFALLEVESIILSLSDHRLYSFDLFNIRYGNT